MRQGREANEGKDEAKKRQSEKEGDELMKGINGKEIFSTVEGKKDKELRNGNKHARRKTSIGKT